MAVSVILKRKEWAKDRWNKSHQ